MFNYIFPILFLISVSDSCNNGKPCKINYDQQELRFPANAQTLYTALNLDFTPYVGYLRKDIESGRTAILELEGGRYLNWNDWDQKEKYFYKNVVGLTVWYPQVNFNYEELKKEIEKEYGIKFSDKYYFETPRKDKSTGEYYLVEYSNCITMVYRHRGNNNVFSIFYDLDKKEIEEYVY